MSMVRYAWIWQATRAGTKRLRAPVPRTRQNQPFAGLQDSYIAFKRTMREIVGLSSAFKSTNIFVGVTLFLATMDASMSTSWTMLQEAESTNIGRGIDVASGDLEGTVRKRSSSLIVLETILFVAVSYLSSIIAHVVLGVKLRRSRRIIRDACAHVEITVFDDL